MSSPRLPDGVIVASITPLDDDGRPDGTALADHLDHLFDRGCDGALLFGTTGEGLSFTVEERRQTLETVLDAGIAPDNLLVGTGALPLPDVVSLTTHATDAGVGGVLVLPPFHFKHITDEGLLATYDRILQGVGNDALRLYLYHNPKLTGVPIPFSLIKTLNDAYPDQIAGIKDSSGEWDHHDSLCSSFPDLQIFAGTERHLTPLLRAGGAGCISATVNITAPLAEQAVRDWQNNTQIASAQSTLTEVRTRLSQFPTIPALKQLLAWRYDRPAWKQVRPPLAPLDDDEEDRLNSLNDSLWTEIEASVEK